MKRWICMLALLFALWTPAVQASAQDDREAGIEAVLAVCVEELGYTATPGGYSKYGDWAGGAYKEWCSEFVSWCAQQAGERTGMQLLDVLYPMQAECQTGVDWFIDRGRYITTTGELSGYGQQWYWEDGVPVAERPYTPSRGDLIYIEWYKYNRIDHVGIVEYLSRDVDGAILVHTIEGNNKILGPEPTNVQRYTYRLDDASIRGYGVTQDFIVGTTLQRGAECSAVATLQGWLTATGDFADEQTGYFGEVTERAVRAFQQREGLEPTGIADAATQRALRTAAGA